MDRGRVRNPPEEDKSWQGGEALGSGHRGWALKPGGLGHLPAPGRPGAQVWLPLWALTPEPPVNQEMRAGPLDLRPAPQEHKQNRSELFTRRDAHTVHTYL